jgi:glucans biosynthesis protein C
MQKIQKGNQLYPILMQSPKPRLFFLDNLRILPITLVFLVHLAITYGSPAGSWYYHEGTVDLPLGAIYVLFQAASQAFFMGLLFLISGYFTPASFDRKGAKQFLKDKLIRFGIPLVIFAVIIEPVINYALALSAGWFHGSFLDFFGYFFTHLNGLPVGPLWFVLALLFFSVAYLGWKIFSRKPTKAYAIPKNGVILSFALLLGAFTFAVRIAVPQGWNFTLLNFQFPYFPQYIALFTLGLIAFRGNWLLTIPKNTGRFWSRIALVLLLLLPMLFIVGFAMGDANSFLGGFSWQAAAYAFWEQLFAVAVSIGLCVWFRERLNFQNRFTKALSESSYTAYILQAPILVFLALSLQSIQMPLMLKFAIVSPIAVSLCFLIAFLVRKIPIANKVL